MENELKPCPLCGGKAFVTVYAYFPKVAPLFREYKKYSVKCISCEAETDKQYRSKKQAIEAWNR